MRVAPRNRLIGEDRKGTIDEASKCTLEDVRIGYSPIFRDK